MSPKVGTVMGKLSLVAGARQERVTNVAAVKPARAIFQKRKKESLYLILEVTGDPVGRDAIYRGLIRIIGEEYFQASGSVTAKLRQAIGAANSFLLQENLKSLPHEQRAGGVTCIVLREGTVYVAQAGPTAAYVSYQGKLTCFPESELTAEEAAPLGFKRGLAVRFYRSKVGLGDVILLTSGSLAQQASPEQIAQAVVGKDVGPALANLEELAGAGDPSVMLIRVAPVEEKPRVSHEAVVKRSVRPRVKREAVVRRPVEPRVKREAVVKRPVKPKVKEALKERLPRPDWDSLKSRMSSAWRGAGDFLRRLLPEAPSPSERVPRPRRPYRPVRKGRNLWMGIAIAIPVIVVILVIVVYWRQALDRQARFEELIAQAQQQMELVGQVDEATARGHLQEALGYLAEAETLGTGDPQVDGLQEQADNKLKEIDRVIKLDWIVPLWEYDEPGSDPSRDNRQRH